MKEDFDFKPVKHKKLITFTCGKETCSYGPNDICSFFVFGPNVSRCAHFSKEFGPFKLLHTNKGDYALRLDECLKAYPETVGKIIKENQ
jgi:hypothetical protein